jgi:hypothetical protein
MAKAKKPTPKKRKSKYDITVKAPEAMTFEDLVKLAATTPKKKK